MRSSLPARCFLADRTGIAGVEFVLIAPILLVVFIGGFTLFDWLRAAYVTEKATFTIGDLMSRQLTVDDPLFQQMKQTFEHLAVNDVGAPQLRISSLKRVCKNEATTCQSEAEQEFEVDWTYNSSETSDLSARDLPVELLPDIALHDSVILTESVVRVIPKFNFALEIFGSDGLELEYVATTRPRFVAQISQVSGS